jgi:hypothetical protein
MKREETVSRAIRRHRREQQELELARRGLLPPSMAERALRRAEFPEWYALPWYKRWWHWLTTW